MSAVKLLQRTKNGQNTSKTLEELFSNACSGCFNPNPFADVSITMLVNVDN